MRKAVEEYLEDRGCRVVRQPAEPAPCTFETLVDGFLVHVLRLDSESYRRAFWSEAYRNGHTIGHVPRTFEAFLRRNARTFEEKVSLLLGVAALALRLDPDCIPATWKEYIRKAGCPRIPRKVISWLVRHQVA